MSSNHQISRKRKRANDSRSRSTSTENSNQSKNNKRNKRQRPINLKKKTLKNLPRTVHSKKISNIYASSNLEVISGGEVRFIKGRDVKFDEVNVDNSIVPKLKPEFEELGVYKKPIAVRQAHFKSPDEILTGDYKFETNELVYLSREEIKDYIKMELPDEDISNAIHYYVGQRIKTRLGLTDEEYDKNYSRFMNGSALLAMSALVSRWTEDCAGKSTFKTHMERIRRNERSDANSIDEFVRIYADDDEDNEDEEENNSDENNTGTSNESAQIKRSTISNSGVNSSDSDSDENDSVLRSVRTIRM